MVVKTEKAKIGSLWIGGDLSWIEVASIQSFLDTGHDYTLYTYDAVGNVPEGATIADARDVWDTEEIIYHETAKSPAIHADVFRVMMVATTDKIWADTDIIAIRALPANLEWYIGFERTDRPLLGNAILGMPKNSKTLQRLHDFLTAENPIPPFFSKAAKKRLIEAHEIGETLNLGKLAWGATGPTALSFLAHETGEIENAQPVETFFPVSFQGRKSLVIPDQKAALDALLKNEKSLCVHLYSRWMRKFTKKLPGGVPREASWLGTYLSEQGVFDYTTLPARKKNRGNQSPPLKSIHSDIFYADLNRRKENLPTGPILSPHGNVTLVTMAKDEGPYLLEWVAYHHLLGFTDILMLTNDSTDGTNEMVTALCDLGFLSHIDNTPWRDKPPQSRGLKRAQIHPLVTNADWIMVMDLDEFITIKTGDGTINSLIGKVLDANATAMPLTWRFFGSCDNIKYHDELVTERFTTAAPDTFSKGFGVKTLFQNFNHLRLAIHRPKLKPAHNRDGSHELKWINGSGKFIDGKIMSWRQTLGSCGYELGQINHYGVKSREEYLMRRLRGDVLNNHDKYDDAYFRTFDRNEVVDTSALRQNAEVRALIDQLLEIRKVRDASKLISQNVKAKYAKLRTANEYGQQISQLTGSVK